MLISTVPPIFLHCRHYLYNRYAHFLHVFVYLTRSCGFVWVYFYPYEQVSWGFDFLSYSMSCCSQYIPTLFYFLSAPMCSPSFPFVCLNSLQFLQFLHQLGFLVRSHACKYCGSQQNLQWKHFQEKNNWKTIDHILIWLIIFVIERKMVLLSNSSVWTKILFNLIIVHFTTPLVFVCMHHFIGAFVWSSVRIFLLGLHRTHYLWQILREVVTEDGKGLATNSQVIAKTTLV